MIQSYAVATYAQTGNRANFFVNLKLGFLPHHLDTPQVPWMLNLERPETVPSMERFHVRYRWLDGALADH